MAPRVSGPSMVGRDDSLASAEEAVRAAAGEARIVVVAGEAGVGKTRCEHG